jgi:hypothetical protein
VRREPGAPLGSIIGRGSAAGPAEDARHRTRARVGNPGRRLTGEQTDGAANAQEIDVPAPDEQRVRNTHEARITCNEPDCPGSVRHVDGAKGHIRGHTRGNVPGSGSYSRLASRFPDRDLPLTLAEPAERGLGSRLRSGLAGRRHVLAVTPGAPGALLVLPLPARDADHVSIVRRRPGIASRYGG